MGEGVSLGGLVCNNSVYIISDGKIVLTNFSDDLCVRNIIFITWKADTALSTQHTNSYVAWWFVFFADIDPIAIDEWFYICETPNCII